MIDSNPMDRRTFLRASGALALSAALQPRWMAAAPDTTRPLILVELKGGNDGLSTVVPLRNPEYIKARKSALVRPVETLALDADHGLHPNLARIATAFHQGQIAIVECVGFPKGERSHFLATDIWHSADPERGAATEGWIARLGDQAWPERGSDAVIHFGNDPLRAHYSARRAPLAVRNPLQFAKLGAGPKGWAERPVKKGKKGTPPSERPVLERIRRIEEEADRQSQRIRVATAGYRTSVNYPNYPLAQNLRDIAAVLHFPEGPVPRVLSTTYGGFDTHARQRNTHNRLMAELDHALSAFLRDLGRSELGRRAVVLVYSEFGRRVNENGSQGTDHGKGGPVFVLGHQLQGGLYGQPPELSVRDNGDVPVTTDFRSVYATLIEELFDQDSTRLLGKSFPKVGFLA